MKKVRLLCLLALVIAIASAFKTKDDFNIYRVSDGGSDFHWVLAPPPNTECDPIVEAPCSYLLKDGSSVPANDTEPPSVDVIAPSSSDGAYQ